jgi:glycosyltransferase involved in cell wall biosynthesis/SAM-dependent methyltransferase
MPDEAKTAAREAWSTNPAGWTFGEGAAPGTPEFFRNVVARRSSWELPWLAETIPFESFRDQDVLELGCGAGYDAATILGAGARYVGIDLADANPPRARRHLEGIGHRPRLLQGDAERLPFGPELFDVVFSNGVLHHTPDMHAAFREAYRVLRPGGRFFVVLYHRDSIFYWLSTVLCDWVLRAEFLRMSLADRRSLIESTNSDARPLVNVYGKGEVGRLLRDAGFAVDDLCVRKLVVEDFPGRFRLPKLWRRLPGPAIDLLGRAFGWYVVGSARKPVVPAAGRFQVLVSPQFGKAPAPAPGVDGRSPRDLKAELEAGTLLSRVRRYREATALVGRTDLLPRPFLTSAALLLLARERRGIEDGQGRRVEVDARRLARLALEGLRDLALGPVVAGRALIALERLERGGRPTTAPRLDLSATPLYFRPFLHLGIEAGGSLTHTAGVVNNLAATAAPPLFLTIADVPLVDPSIETVRLPEPGRLHEWSTLWALDADQRGQRAARQALGGRRPGWIYQRCEVDHLGGLLLARSFGVPFVLEYNGSELWVTRNWGHGRIPHQALSTRIEQANLLGADLVVVVSEPLREELLQRGVEDRRILVNPNGVDPARFRPDLDGSGVRRALGLEGKLVVGFIGTFGVWHGAEVLAEAWSRLMAREPALSRDARLLFIGAGSRLEATREAIQRGGAAGSVVFTGLVPQAQGPSYLAACDVLVAPHVPNADGSRFFGSPTKLFEYMAMGRGIVSTSLDQLGVVLEHDRTAWLVPPGDVEALAGGILRLARDPTLRARLGAAAREAAVERHTWRAHTARIVEALTKLSY